MVRLIYKFLDESAGPGVRLINQNEYYAVCSDNYTHIFSFRMKDDWTWFKIYREKPLCRTISGLFSVTEDEAAKHVSSWFGNRNNIIKVEDLKKFV